MATAIAQETVRLKQAVKSTYRVAIQPAVVAGVEVPPGTVVQAYWHPATLATGPGVEEFRPEHWLSEDRRRCRMNDDPNSMQVCLGAFASVRNHPQRLDHMPILRGISCARLRGHHQPVLSGTAAPALDHGVT